MKPVGPAAGPSHPGPRARPDRFGLGRLGLDRLGRGRASPACACLAGLGPARRGPARARPRDRGPGLPRAALALLAGLALAACAGDEPEVAIACPEAALLDGADHLGIFRDREPSAAGLRYQLTLADLASGCRASEDGPELELAFTLAASTGPAYATETIAGRYFIATLGPDRQLLSKQVFTSDLPAPDRSGRAGVREALALRLPPPGSAAGVPSTVYVGLQP